MSEHNSIYNKKGQLVGRFRHGVAWSSPKMERLGEYVEDFVYDNNGSMIAEINDGHVLNIIGEELGHIAGKQIFLAGCLVGNYIGSASAGASSIAFIFNNEGTHGS